MHEEHIVCKVRQHKYNSYKGQIGKIAPNLLMIIYPSNSVLLTTIE